MNAHEELFSLAFKLNECAEKGDIRRIKDPLDALENAANVVGKSFSGSWEGYHSLVYYENFAVPPPGAHFSQEWGLQQTFSGRLGSKGAWREYKEEDVKAHILSLAGSPDLVYAKEVAAEVTGVFDLARADTISIMQGELKNSQDPFLESLNSEIQKLNLISANEIADQLSPNSQFMTRDTIVLGQGRQVPPHIELIAEANAIRFIFNICKEARDIAKKAASHIERKVSHGKTVDRIGTNIFIGHGRSLIWRDLKDFLQDRLKLPWDEFNREPVAGVTNIARLSEMLDSAAFAFIVMTAEDEMVDGAKQARMNVTHEAGLFQGRLGFSRAVVMLEDGCEEFTNIEGLGQIRFPAGNISAVFEEVRRVLEREKLIKQA